MELQRTIKNIVSARKHFKIVFGILATLGLSSSLNAQNNTFYSANAGGNVGGSDNCAIGPETMFGVTGSYNTAIGRAAMHSYPTGSYNCAVGAFALSKTSGSYNSAVGNGSLNANTTGSLNTASGYLSMSANTNGSYNTAYGSYTLSGNTSGKHNSAFGYQSLLVSTGDNNTALGFRCMYSNTTGTYNTSVGFAALYSNTTGFNNVANGDYTLYSNTTGAYNVASGGRALYSIVSGNRSSAFGYQALTSSTGGNNTAIGFRSLYNNTTGIENTACGLGALASNTTGSSNTGIGIWADVGAGNLSNATAVGYLALVTASNKVRIGNSSVTVIEGEVPYSYTSDGRFKTNVNEADVKGLEFINKLRPVVYNLDTRKLTEFRTKNMPEEVRKQHLNQDFAATTKIRQSGFIAQEVEKAAKEAGYDFNGVHAPQSDNDNYSIAYSQFVVPLVKGMQEQQKMIEDQKQMVEKLQQQVNELLKNQGTTTGVEQTSLIGASMEQNVPNPFTHETVIHFNLPQEVNTAYMTVYDLSGKQLKTLPINQRGASSITVTADQLAAGMYVYSIVADGKIVSSKRMIVADK